MKKKGLFFGVVILLALILFAGTINLLQINTFREFLGIDRGSLFFSPEQEFILAIYNPPAMPGEVFSSVQESDVITGITYQTNLREEDIMEVVVRINGIEVPSRPEIYEDMLDGRAKNLLDTGVLFVPGLFRNGENNLEMTAFDKKGRTAKYSASINFDDAVPLRGYQPREPKAPPTFKVESFEVNGGVKENQPEK